MRLIAQLSTVVFCTFIIFTGCDERMSQSVMEVIPKPQPEPLTHIEKARADMARVNQLRTEAQQNAEAAGDYTTVFTDSEHIFIEELGFSRGFWVELVNIYRDAKSDDSTVTDGYTRFQDIAQEHLLKGTFGTIYFDYIRTFDPLVVEYLRLSYVYPTQSQEALLTQFRDSVENTKVIIVFPEDF